jgi:hypothetical protein
MKLECAKEEYTVCCIRNDRSGSAWVITGIWKLRGMNEGFEEGRCPQDRKNEDALPMLLKCLGTRK